MNSVESLQNRGKGAAVTRKHGYKINTASIEAQHAAEEMMLQIENDMKNASAKLAAEQAERMVKDSIAASMERIKNENESMRTWEENMIRRSGYTVDGKNIHRDAVVDSTIGKTYYETQNVHYYEDFYNAEPTISVSLSKTMLEGLNSSAIMLLVEQANYDIENWSTDIFVKVEKDDEGKCQMGQIMLDFQWNCMIEQQGWQKVALPAYDQPLWRGVSARRKCRQITIRKQRCYA